MIPNLAERVGIWTRIVQEIDCVKVMRARTYLRGAILKWLFVAILVFMFSEFIVNNFNKPFGVVITSLVLLIIACKAYSGIRQSLRELKTPVLVILDRDAERTSDTRPGRIHAAEIARIVVRENEGRKIEDPAQWQTYLHMKESGESILIHQRYKWNLEKERELAEASANRWEVELHAPV